MDYGLDELQEEIRSLARSHTKKAVKVLVGIMNQPKAKPAARVSAANAILDRGWGKPAQAVEVAGAGGGALVVEVVRFSDDAAKE